uniref:Calpain catalytic domain-containing protein n=1 Tax=Aureoumbra lagunensis TaxID=44058 RepID=A0A7S3NGY5_9STRA|mmetsp:Transcript_6821/g.10116  ORF Transcript_6821/g.10116 Transcript_6821/m.10116 type:complete len:630 (+) Transcript_6821:44-1933(+)
MTTTTRDDEFYRQEAALLGVLLPPPSPPAVKNEDHTMNDEEYARQLQKKIWNEERTQSDERYARELQNEMQNEISQDNTQGDEDNARQLHNQLLDDVPSWPTRHVLIREDARPDDIQQGSQIGSCWLLSTISALVSLSIDALKRIFKNENLTSGRINVQLYEAGLPRILSIDPSTFPYGVSSCRRNQLFAPVIEKAVAELRGGYEKLDGGRCVEALEMLTGCPCEEVQLTKEEDDDAWLWARLLSAHEAGFVSCVSTKNAQLTSDLAPSHAYAIVSILELFEPPPPLGTGTRHRLLRLANPHGPESKYSWQGQWSEHSSCWTPEMRQAALDNSGGTSSSIATFFISLIDLRRHFATLSICEYRPHWFEHRLSLIDDAVCSMQNVDQYDTSIEATAQLFAPSDAGILILKDSRVIASAPIGLDRTNPCHVHVSAQDTKLIVLPLSFNQQASRNLVIRSSRPLLVASKSPLSPSLRRNAILSYVRSASKTEPISGYAFVHTRTDTAACFVVVDNIHPHARLQVKISVLEAYGLNFSRQRVHSQANTIVSTIPPGYTALVLLLAASSASFGFRLQKQFQFISPLRCLASEKLFKTIFHSSSSAADDFLTFEPPLIYGLADDLHAPVPLTLFS